MKRWEQFGSRLGVGFCLAGFVLIFVGWNGAASVNSVPAQFPYLISGGMAGLGLIVLGAALILVDARREDQARLEALLSEVKAALDRAGPPEPEELADTGTGPKVVVGHTSFHRPECRLLVGRGELPELSRETAMARGLIACRICDPGPVAARPTRARRGGARPRSRRR